MSMTDPISDFLTRIRNAQKAGHLITRCLNSNINKRILDVLISEGYIQSYREIDIRPSVKELEVNLKYYEGNPVIHEINRVSKPGRRIYISCSNIPLVRNGLGLNILSTSKGIISEVDAKKIGIGGELICQVF